MCLLDSIVGVGREDRETVYLTVENGRYVPAPPIVYVPGLKQIRDRLERQQWLRPQSYDTRRANSRRNTRADFLPSHRSPAYMFQPIHWMDGPSSPSCQPRRPESEPGIGNQRSSEIEAPQAGTGAIKKSSVVDMAHAKGVLEHGGTRIYSPDGRVITKPLKSILKNGSSSPERSTPLRTRKKSVSFENAEDARPTDTKIANDKGPPSPPTQAKVPKKQRKQARKEANQSSKRGPRLKGKSAASFSTAQESNEPPAEKADVVQEEDDTASDTDWELAKRIKRHAHWTADLFSTGP